ncbi:MAG TPA: hypothetical protein VJ865_05450 [Gemmatimonadaceae bacterium]|nr:hypothetical protein [Gemmatimonadaceae bacterium]
MVWTTEQGQALRRENARIGFRADDLLPAPGHPDLTKPAEYLALLQSIPDGAGVAGYVAALRRYVEQHPIDERR